MNIILPLHPQWIKKIFLKEKVYEFRNRLPKNFQSGTAFLYETSKCGGSKMVVGEIEISEIRPLEQDNHNLGCYMFLKDYAEIYQGFSDDAEKALVTRNIQSMYDATVPNYKNDCLVYYLFFDGLIETVLEKGLRSARRWAYDCDDTYDKHRFEAQKFMESCDKWLTNMGYYDEVFTANTDWEYALCISSVKQYKFPIPLSALNDRAGNPIAKAPQSWCYTSSTQMPCRIAKNNPIISL